MKVRKDKAGDDKEDVAAMRLVGIVEVRYTYAAVWSERAPGWHFSSHLKQ